jgi:hypothetical protein
MKFNNLFTLIKFRILFIVFAGIGIISFVLIQHGYSTARDNMIAEKQRQIRSITKNAQEEIEATFYEALHGKMSMDDAPN